MNKNIQLFLLACISIYLWFQGPPSFGPSSAPVMGGTRSGNPVSLTAVVVEPMHTIRTFTGTLESQEHFDVAARAGGTVQQLHVDIGDRVTSGQILAILEDSQQALVVAQARAELLVAMANQDDAAARAELAQVSLNRMRSLRQQNIASAAELDQAKAEWEVQQARLRLAQAQVEQRRLALEQTRLLHSYFQVSAEWSDDLPRIVERRHIERGSYITAGTPVASLAKIHSLYAVVALTQADYSALNPGDQVEIRVASQPGETFHGTVQRKAPALDELSRHARVEIALPNPELKLQPGMFVQVSWHSTNEHPVQQVPHNAITYRNGKPVLFFLDDSTSTVRLVEVEVGREDNRMVEILSPQISGSVVTAGHERLRDADTVTSGQKKP